MVEQIVVEEFDRKPATHQLHDTVDVMDPLLEQVFLALLEQAKRGSRKRLHIDSLLIVSLLIVFATALLERHSTLHARQYGGEAPRAVPCYGGLAGWQLRRVIDFMHAHMSTTSR